MKECTIIYSLNAENWVICENGKFDYTINYDTTEKAVIAAYRQGFTTIKIENR
jgi:hypothetical protein